MFRSGGYVLRMGRLFGRGRRRLDVRRYRFRHHHGRRSLVVLRRSRHSNRVRKRNHDVLIHHVRNLHLLVRCNHNPVVRYLSPETGKHRRTSSRNQVRGGRGPSRDHHRSIRFQTIRNHRRRLLVFLLLRQARRQEIASDRKRTLWPTSTARNQRKEVRLLCLERSFKVHHLA
jgi:hypothetical protein